MPINNLKKITALEPTTEPPASEPTFEPTPSLTVFDTLTKQKYKLKSLHENCLENL